MIDFWVLSTARHRPPTPSGKDGLRAVAEWEARHGALMPEELASADAIVDRTARRPRKRRAS